MTNTVKGVVLEVSDDEIDASIKAQIEKEWDEEPTALQVLKVLDKMIFTAGASTFYLVALHGLMSNRLKEEDKTYEELVEEATWRNEE